MIIIVIVLLLCLLGFSLFLFFYNNLERKLKNIGYTNEEVAIILNKVPHESYNEVLNLGYNKSLINILSAKNYLDSNFDLYLNYYMKNKGEDINNIITIMNYNADLINLPASDLLANLVQEKYYINDKVTRYLDYGNSQNVDAKKVIAIVNSNADLGFYNSIYESNLNDNNLILVNKFYALKNDYVPSDLITLSGQYNRGFNNKMRKEAADSFMNMVDAAKLDNIILYNVSAYRDYAYQENLYNIYIKKDGKDEADKYSARPGHSEHQTGLSLDINNISDDFENSDEAVWLQNNAYKYGFILRFPKGKEDITGYKYEPWHYRYVGIEAAKVIYDDDITLEEYYAYYIENTSN